MKKPFIIVLMLVNFSYTGHCQIREQTQTAQTFEKARYLNNDLSQTLLKLTVYPDEALKKGLQGDVLLTYTITKDGLLKELEVATTPGLLLSTSAIVAINSLDDKWSSTRINEVPVDRKYTSVFRFRIYVNVPPVDNKKKALTLLEKEKYSNALKPLEKAIEDNPYDYELFVLRSKVKEKLGDTAGANDDLLASQKLNNEVISVISIPKQIKNTTTRTITYTETRIEAVPVTR